MRALLYLLAVFILQPLPLLPGASGGTYVPPTETFEILTAKPAVKFLTQAVQPPSQVYITNRDALQVSAASSMAGESLVVSWRVLKADSTVAFSQFTMPVSSGRVLNSHTESLPEGFLLSLSCRAVAAGQRGQTFARMFLTAPGLGVGQPAAMLMSDYVTTAMATGFPNGRILSPVEGPGNIRSIPLAPFGLGLEFQFVEPTNARWVIMALDVVLHTSAVAGTRLPTFNITSFANTLFNTPAIFGAGPSVQARYVFGAGLPNAQDTLLITSVPLPRGLVLSGLLGSAIQSFTVGLDAGDQWSQLVLTVEEWLDNI
jgi:hypothetical protein